MTSMIDPTVPLFGTPTTASVRQNFIIAKREIEALQGAVAGVRPPPITFNAGGNIALPSIGDQFIFVFNTTGTPITLFLPNGSVVGQVVIIKDTAGNAGTYQISINAVGTIDAINPYLLVSDYASISLVWIGGLWGTF